MTRKYIKVLALTCVSVGVFASAPSPANAFHGNLIHCTPTAGIGIAVTLKKGLTCTDSVNKIGVSATGKSGNQLDGCTPNLGAPWANWATNKWASKISGLDVATIAKADVSIKALTYGSCNFSGDANSATASGGGKLVFFAADGVTKVKGGKGSFFARVAGDVPSQSALAIGLMTKGIGLGAGILTQIGIDLAGPSQCGMTSCNGLILACNTGAICPPDPFGPNQPAITTLDLKTDANSKLDISIQSNTDCTAANAPYPCCTGAGTGTC